jgi:hypothetical protein
MDWEQRMMMLVRQEKLVTRGMMGRMGMEMMLAWPVRVS